MAVKTTGAQHSSANSLYVYQKADLLIISLRKKTTKYYYAEVIVHHQEISIH